MKSNPLKPLTPSTCRGGESGGMQGQSVSKGKVWVSLKKGEGRGSMLLFGLTCTIYYTLSQIDFWKFFHDRKVLINIHLPCSVPLIFAIANQLHDMLPIICYYVQNVGNFRQFLLNCVKQCLHQGEGTQPPSLLLPPEPRSVTVWGAYAWLPLSLHPAS